jgi:hypothetical protein
MERNCVDPDAARSYLGSFPQCPLGLSPPAPPASPAALAFNPLTRVSAAGGRSPVASPAPDAVPAETSAQIDRFVSAQINHYGGALQSLSNGRLSLNGVLTPGRHRGTGLGGEGGGHGGSVEGHGGRGIVAANKGLQGPSRARYAPRPTCFSSTRTSAATTTSCASSSRPPPASTPTRRSPSRSCSTASCSSTTPSARHAARSRLAGELLAQRPRGRALITQRPTRAQYRSCLLWP